MEFVSVDNQSEDCSLGSTLFTITFVLLAQRLTLILWVAVALFAPPARASIVGQWLFNNSSLVDDSSGNGLTLTAVGAPVFDPTARGGLGAVSLNGSSYFTIDPFPSGVPLGNSDYTITAWINTTDQGRDGIVGWGSYGDQNQVNAFRTLSQAEGGGMINYWWANDDYFTGHDVYDGAWHFVAVTFDGATRTMYIDGASQSSAASGINSQAVNFTIGRTLFSEYFVGELSDIQIFDTALSPAQISQQQSVTPEPVTFLLVAPAMLLCLRKRRNE